MQATPHGRRRWLFAGTLLGVYAAGALALSLATNEEATLRLDLEVSAGAAMEVFINDFSEPPILVPLRVGHRHLYEISGLYDDVSMLRFDPSDRAEAVVRIFLIQVVNRHRVLATFGPKELAQWGHYNLERISDPDALSFRTTSVDPALSAATQIPLDVGATSVPARLRDALRTSPYLLALVLTSAVIFSAAFRQRTRLAGPVILVAAAALTTALAATVAAQPLPGDTVHVALSRASYLGFSTRANQAAGAVVVLFALGLGAAGLAWMRSVRPLPDADAGEEGAERLGAVWWPTVAIALMVALLAPDLGQALALIAAPVQPNWDGDNLLYWAYLVHTGAVPFRDFWYPYGGFYLFDLAWPAGPLIRWAYDASLYALLTSSLLLLVPARRTGAALLTVVGLIVLDRLSLMGEGETRYFLAPLVVLAYVACHRVQPGDWRGPVLLLVSVALATVFEPFQLFYAAPALAALALLNAWSAFRQQAFRWSMFRAPIALACSVVATLAALAGVLAWTGQLDEALVFYTRLGDSARYSAFPTPLARFAWDVLPIGAVGLWWPCALIALGVVDLAGEDESRTRGLVILGIGLTAAITVQKHLVRPMDGHLISHVVLASVLYLLFWPGRFKMPVVAATGAVAGLVLLFFSFTEHGASAATFVAQAPNRVATAIDVLSDGARVARANAERFADGRFRLFSQQMELIRTLTPPDARRPSLFALSDEPTLYLLTSQRPVWVSNIYNASPVYEQRELVEWMDRERPAYVVFSPDSLHFDSIPTFVRVPFVGAAVGQRYVPSRRIGAFEVLRPRQADEPLPLAYWREIVGAVTDLGHIPSFVRLDGRQPCSPPAACDLYVRVRGAQFPDGLEHATLGFELHGLTFRVRFAVPERDRDALVPLTRLWMFEMLGETISPSVDATLRLEPSVDWERVLLTRDPEILY